jgi:hypothetical protein
MWMEDGGMNLHFDFEKTRIDKCISVPVSKYLGLEAKYLVRIGMGKQSWLGLLVL